MFKWTHESGAKKSKTVLVRWAPDSCLDTTMKFQYTNCVNVLKDKCAPIDKEFQINDPADLTLANFMDELN